jgi:hypothetical protein
MAHPQVLGGGEGLKIWRAAAILNKQWRTADKGWSYNLAVGRGANSSSSKKNNVTKFYTRPQTWLAVNIPRVSYRRGIY